MNSKRRATKEAMILRCMVAFIVVRIVVSAMVFVGFMSSGRPQLRL